MGGASYNNEIQKRSSESKPHLKRRQTVAFQKVKKPDSQFRIHFKYSSPVIYLLKEMKEEKIVRNQNLII